MNQVPTYSSSEARAKLKGMAPSSLKALSDKGIIRKIVPPGKTQGRYLKEDVDRYAEEMEHFEQAYSFAQPPTTYAFGRVQNESELKESVRIARQNLGENAYGMDRRMPWFKLSPLGDYVLKHENVVVGYFSMQAIKPEAINDVFNKKSGRSIILDDMVPIEPGTPLDIHISGIGVKKGISKQQARIYGVILVFKLLHTLIDMGRQGFYIRKLWAKSSTVAGIKLCRGIGFTELDYINNEQIGFVLDLETSDLPIAQKYREALAEYQKSQS
jgi:hypothetical protein